MSINQQTSQQNPMDSLPSVYSPGRLQEPQSRSQLTELESRKRLSLAR
jgi:hypothetical protein